MRLADLPVVLLALSAAAAPAAAASLRAATGVPLVSAPLSAYSAAAPSLPPLASPSLAAQPAGPAPTFPPAAEIPSLPPRLASVSAARPQAAGTGRGARAVSAGAQARSLSAAAPGEGSGGFDGAAVPDKKDLESVHPLDLEPMQIPVGMREVEEKEKKLRGMSEHEQKKWLEDNAVPYVLRKGKRRPIDHHHEARAAWQAGLDRVYAYSAVGKKEQERLDAMSDAQFWAEMKRRGWWYDRDQFGEGPRGPELLPEDTRGHADDPFRSLAGEVRKRGGYEKTAVPFAEFAWANYFRKRLKTFPRGDGYEKAVQEALALAGDPAAKDLPGYTGGAAAKKAKASK